MPSRSHVVTLQAWGTLPGRRCSECIRKEVDIRTQTAHRLGINDGGLAAGERHATDVTSLALALEARMPRAMPHAARHLREPDALDVVHPRADGAFDELAAIVADEARVVEEAAEVISIFVWYFSRERE